MNTLPSILIADDHPIVAAGLAASLQTWYDVLGVVTSLDMLEVEIARMSPHVVLLDLTFGTQSSLHVLPRLHERFPSARFVILTVHCEPVLADAALRAGASAFVVKESAPNELRLAIEAALNGSTYVTPLVRERESTRGGPADRPGRIQFTEIEVQLLMLLRSGYTQQSAGDRLGISRKGVEYHLGKLRKSLGVTNTSQLIRWAEQYLDDEGLSAKVFPGTD